MEYIEFDPANPQEYENFMCEDERKQSQKITIVFVSILVFTLGIGMWILYQQHKEFNKKRNSFATKL
jgi:hypothetical protein